MPSRTRAWAVAALAVAAAATSTGAAEAADTGFTLSTTHPAQKGFAPAFVGNGYLAGRQPAEGQGYAVVPLAGPDDLPDPVAGPGLLREGLRARHRPHRAPRGPARLVDPRLRRRQRPLRARTAARCAATARRLDLRTGTLTTRVRWTSPAGRTADLRYDVTPDRAHPHAALVRLRVVPRFDGRIALTDVLDGRAARADPRRRARTAGLGPVGGPRQPGHGDPGHRRVGAAGGRPHPAPRGGRRTPQRRPARRGCEPAAAARSSPRSSSAWPSPATRAPPARRTGARWLRRCGRPTAATATAAPRPTPPGLGSGGPTCRSTATRASSARPARRCLPSSPRSARAMPWAPSPGGLSSDGYNGHVFWDSETWMYPTLLAVAPDIARATLRYRFDRLAAARAQRSPHRLRRRPVPVGVGAGRAPRRRRAAATPASGRSM